MDQARLELETLSVEVQLRGPSPGYRPRRRPPRRNPSYETIDRVLRDIAAAGPKSQLDVLRELDGRAPIPNAQPFREAGGWMAGFKQNRSAARVWLSRTWSRLGLPPFRMGPKGVITTNGRNPGHPK